MNAEQQKGKIVHGDGGTGGTRDAAHAQPQTFTARDPQRALTDQLMEQVCDPMNLVRAYRRVRSNASAARPSLVSSSDSALRRRWLIAGPPLARVDGVSR